MYNQSGLSVELLTDNGNKITEFSHEGRTYIEGRKGSRYKIKITNHWHTRIKVIISVDGLDILSGKRATPNSGGYVINGYATEIFDGWRISDREIREFFFTTNKNSYNARTGNDTNNLGVIGVMAYKEYTPSYFVNTYNTFDSGRYYLANQIGGSAMPVSGTATLNMLNSAVATSTRSLTSSTKLTKSASVGTGMGAVKQSKVEKVNTTWEASAFATVEVYYKTRKELEAMGIQVVVPKERPLPSAFEGYCKQV